MSWKKIDEEILNENPWTTFRRRGFETTDGKRGDYFFAQTRGGCAMAIPRLSDGHFVMVNIYRFLTDEMSIEFPAGGIETDQDPIDGLKMELRQEVGYEAESIKLLHIISPSNGVIIDESHIYLCEDLVYVGETHEWSEDMKIVTVTEAEIDQMIRENKIRCAQTLAAWAIYKSRAV